MLVCSRDLRALHAWRGHVFGVLACFLCSHTRCALHARVLTCFMKWCAWRASKNWRAWRALKIGVLHKMACLACLKLIKCFLDVFDQTALVNCGLC